MEAREAKANAQVLEMVGDIPDADAKPPENVLFVCKLNPVTTDEDLEIIFSRFGPILSCEVIRDQKSGDSLQYAFIEFENEEDCIKAYFKMDNVLIDDRRIHVDFSQSLAKVKGISRRKYSEEESMADGKERKKKAGDGLVAKSKGRGDDSKYEMVFGGDDDEEEEEKEVEGKGVSKRSKPQESRRQKDGDGRQRDRGTSGIDDRERDRRDRDKDRERDRERDRGRQDRRRSRSRSRDRKHRKRRSRSRSRSRSWSRSRDRKSHGHHHHKRRDRSRSGDRYRRK